MPELPEVETTRRSLAPVLEGRVVVSAMLRHPRTGRRNERSSDVADRLRGRRVVTMLRHGKFIMTEMEDDLTWVIHLGMSGRMEIAKPNDPEQPHTHFVAITDCDVAVRFVDPRTFGFIAVLTPSELATSSFRDLGPDALLELPSAKRLGERMSGRVVAIKTLLLDQRVLAGLGNIYADEVLARAKVHPRRQAGSLSEDEVKAVRRYIKPVLEAGLAHGGTSLDDLAYLLPDGRAGEYLKLLRVYGRDGEPCMTCGTTIDKVSVGGRSSHFCPNCQH